MIARRDVVKLAAAMAAAPAFARLAIDPETAWHRLMEPAQASQHGHRQWMNEVDEGDVIAFAESIDGTDWMSYFHLGAPVEMAEYNQALNLLFDLAGVIGNEPRGVSPMHDAINAVDEAGLALWGAAWSAGVRAGVEYEHLRLALVQPRRCCDACHGNGVTWGGKPYRGCNDGTNAAVCAECGGLGHVATAPARLSTVD